MNIREICNYAALILFWLASAMLAVAFVELVANALGSSIIAHAYAAGRLIEMAAAFLVYVIAVVLFDVRDALTGKSTADQ